MMTAEFAFKPRSIMMRRFVSLTVLFAWMFVVGGRPTKNSKNETGNDVLNTMSPPKMTEVVLTTEGAPPTSSNSRVQTVALPSRTSTTTTTEGDDLSILSTDDPIQTDDGSTKDSPLFFLTSDIRKLNILVIVLAAILMVLIAVVVILGILRRSTQRKMRRMKQEKEETTTTDAATTPPPTESRFYNVEAPHQPVEYEVPYAHQQAMTVQIMALANQNPVNNNVTNHTAPNGLPVITTTMGDGEYINQSVFKATVEESKSTNQNDIQEYKIPRNATKRAELTTNEHLAVNNGSTLKDSRGYVMMMDYAGPVDPSHTKNAQDTDGSEGKKHHVYDVPTKAARSADTFSRSTIRSKIKLFQEKLKSDKSKHIAHAENENGTPKDARESMVKSAVYEYDTPRI